MLKHAEPLYLGEIQNGLFVNAHWIWKPLQRRAQLSSSSPAIVMQAGNANSVKLSTQGI